jgi:hypothetical protein
MHKPLPVAPPFDHQRSELVDVVLHPGNREFVQVWRAGRAGVILSYFRTPDGVTDVHHSIPLDGGPWQRVDVSAATRVLRYARRDALSPRTETFAPSGRLLVNDLPSGLRLERRYTSEFDWDRWAPVGKPLSDRATMKRQDEGAPWFVSFIQQVYGEDDALTSEELVMVEEHRGTTCLRRVERNSEVAGT